MRKTTPSGNKMKSDTIRKQIDKLRRQTLPHSRQKIKKYIECTYMLSDNLTIVFKTREVNLTLRYIKSYYTQYASFYSYTVEGFLQLLQLHESIDVLHIINSSFNSIQLLGIHSNIEANPITYDHFREHLKDNATISIKVLQEGKNTFMILT